MLDAGDHAINEQDRIVAGLAGARRAWPPSPGRAGPAGGFRRRTRRSTASSKTLPLTSSSAGISVSLSATHADVLPRLILVSFVLLELVGCPSGRGTDPLGELLRRCRTVRVQVARNDPADGFVLRCRPESRQPAARIGIGDASALVRTEAQHAAVGSHADRLPPARPQVLESGHHAIASPGPHQVNDRAIQLIKSQLGILQRVADGIDDLLSLYRRRRRREGDCDGMADSAAVHIGRSSVESRCTVPRES